MTNKKSLKPNLLRRSVTPVLVIGAFFIGGTLLGGPGGDVKPEISSGEALGHDHAAESQDPELWTCSMHPQIQAHEPGNCPICGMTLIPVLASTGDELGPDEVALSDSAKIRARIQTTLVKRLASGGVERRLLGRVDYDETRLRTVTSWIGGRIDKLAVKTTGQRVSRGQVIATLYSPEVFGAHQDLLVALQQVKRLSGGSEIAKSGALAALAASRDRLRLLGVSSSDMATMEKAKRPSEQVKIRSKFGGTVIERLATQGDYVKTGTGLFQVADLSRLWVQLDAYESDLALLSVGQEVELGVEALPGETFTGRVTFVDPVLNQRTRTTRVRIEVKNPGGRLRPGMFAEAIVRASKTQSHASALIIPETAPLFTGRRSVVYVEKPDTDTPTYQARVVKLGAKTGDIYPVVAGLKEGERVVTRGAFTLDADLQIRGGLSMMSVPDDLSEGPFDAIVKLPKKVEADMGKMVSHYLSIHEALASEDLAAAKKAASAMTRSVAKMKLGGMDTVRDAWAPLARQLLSHGKHLVSAASIDEARLAFRDISQHIATLLRIFGNPSGETVRLAFCPMALGGEGAEWIQRADKIQNPYLGGAMHTCGDIHESVDHGTFLPLSNDGSATTPVAAPAAGGHQH